MTLVKARAGISLSLQTLTTRNPRLTLNPFDLIIYMNLVIPDLIII